MSPLSVKSARNRPSLLLGAIVLMAPSFAVGQGNCSNDGNIQFNDDLGGVVTFQEATVRNVTGNRDDDRDIGMNTLSGAKTSSAGFGGIKVAGIQASEFPSTGVKSNGFNRNISRFWTTTYSRGQYRFNRRNDLDVDVSFTVNGDEATNGTSAVTLNPKQRNIRKSWYPGTNDLFRLEGDVRFRYRDMHKLAEAGNHSTTLDVCVEVSGNR